MTTTPQPDLTPDASRAILLSAQADAAARYVSGMMDNVAAATRDMETNSNPILVLQALESIKSAIFDLKDVEALLVMKLGQRARTTREYDGVVRDGLRWEVHGGKDRKAWDHDRWRQDVRAKVVENTLAAYDLGRDVEMVTPDGEVTTLSLARMILEAVADVQAAHGASSPKATVLKPLGLDPDDYCETSPGPFTITFTEDVEATTGEDAD